MRVRSLSAIVVTGVPLLMAGCPLGLDLGSLLDFGSGVAAIPDGTYAGGTNGSVEFWEWDELVDEASETGATDAKFANGALLKDSGGVFRVGDVDELWDGAYELTREVYAIDAGEWGYEIAFDLFGEWDGIPVVGWEIATYWLNPDGTIELYDEIELTSEESFDGGAWTIYSESFATMELATPSSRAPEDLLDRKSGKIRR